MPNSFTQTFSSETVRAVTDAVGRTPRVVLLASFVPILSVVVGISALLLTGFIRREYDVHERALVAAQQARVPESEAALRAEVARAEQIGWLLGEHRDGAAPLRLLSEHAQAEIGIRSVAVDYAAATFSLAVHAPSVAALAQQVAAFEDDARVREVAMEQLLRRDDPARFETTIRVVFDDALLLAFPDSVSGETL